MKSYGILVGSIIVLITLMAAPAAADLTFASSCPETIAEGDTFTITGTGATNGSIAVMVFGRNYFQALTANPGEQGAFSVVLPPKETRNFLSGQYAFVILDPGANGHFEIGSQITAAGNISITDRGVTVADLGPVRDLKASVHPEVATLLAISGRAGVDDIVTPSYFFVELPFVHFDQKSDAETHQLVLERGNNNRLFFSGTTNIGEENTLAVRIYNTATRDRIISAELPVIVQNGITEPGRKKWVNSWHYELDATRLEPGEYIISVGWQKDPTAGTGTALFTITDTLPAIKQDTAVQVFPSNLKWFYVFSPSRWRS